MAGCAPHTDKQERNNRYKKIYKVGNMGFTFADYNPQVLADRVFAAIELWQNEEKRYAFAGKIMRTDFSWQSSATK